MKIGDVVSWKTKTKMYTGIIREFVPAGQDAFDFRDEFKEVPDSRCEFRFVEDYDRAIVVVKTGKYHNLDSAYAPPVNILQTDGITNLYTVTGWRNYSPIVGEFEADNIMVAINDAIKNGYENIQSAMLKNDGIEDLCDIK